MSTPGSPIEELMPLPKVAKILNMSMKTLWRRINAGELAVVRDDGVVSVIPDDLRTYINKRRSPAPAVKDVL